MARRNTISNDIFNEYLNAIDEGLNPPQKPAAPATVGMGSLRQTEGNLPPEPTFGNSMGDFRRVEGTTPLPIAGMDYEIPQAPYQARFDHLKNLTDPTMATGVESEWWNPVTPAKQPILAQDFATPFVRGATGVVGGMGGAVRMAGLEGAGKSIVDATERINSELAQSGGERLLQKKPFEWSDMIMPDFWTDGRAVALASSAAGSSAPFAVGSLLMAALAPASMAGATTATVTALGRAALSTSAGRATIGKLMTNPAMQKLAANTFGKMGEFGKAYTAARVVSSVPEALTEGGSSYNDMAKWNEAAAIVSNPNLSQQEKAEAKGIIRQLYQQAGGQGEPDFDHLPTIDDAKLRAWKQTAANVPMLALSNALEGATLFNPSKNAIVGTGRKAISNAILQGGEEYFQAGAETGITGFGKQGTPIQGEEFVWSLNPASWTPETKQQVAGGALFGFGMGAAGGPVNTGNKGIVNQAIDKFTQPAQAPAQPAAQPEQTKLKIGEIIPDSENQDVVMRFEGLKPDGENIGSREGVFTLVDTNGNPILNEDGSPRRVVYDLPISVVDKSVGYFDENAITGTAPIAPENNTVPANPANKVPKAANSVDSGDGGNIFSSGWKLGDGIRNGTATGPLAEVNNTLNSLRQQPMEMDQARIVAEEILSGLSDVELVALLDREAFGDVIKGEPALPTDERGVPNLPAIEWNRRYPAGHAAASPATNDKPKNKAEALKLAIDDLAAAKRRYGANPTDAQRRALERKQKEIDVIKGLDDWGQTNTITPGPAVWKSKDGDISVNITGLAGEKDGVQYVNIEGSNTAIPLNEISPVQTENVPTNISPKEQSTFAVGDKVTSSKGAGVVSIVTKTGIGVKTADGKKFSVSWDNVEKFGLKKEGSGDGAPASGKSSVSTGTSVDILNDIATGKNATRKGLRDLGWEYHQFPSNLSSANKNYEDGSAIMVSYIDRGAQNPNAGKFEVIHWVQQGNRKVRESETAFATEKEAVEFALAMAAKKDAISAAPVPAEKPQHKVNSDKIEIGNTVTRPGQNDGFVVVDDSDPSMFVVRTKQGNTVKTGKKGVVKSGSAADVAPAVQETDAETHYQNWKKEMLRAIEREKEEGWADKEHDDSVLSPTDVLLNPAFYRDGYTERFEQEQAPKKTEAAKHSVGDKVTVSGEQGEATVTAVQGDNVVAEMDNVGVSGTKITTVPKEAVAIDTPESKYRKAIKYDKADGETKAKYDMNFTHIKNILDEKDSYKKYAGLRDSFISNDNKRWMAAYDAITGETIPRKQGERLQYLQDKYPEEHKRLMASKAEKRAKSDAEMRRARINGTKVNHDGKVIGRADFIDAAIEGGYRKAVRRPQGAAFVYHLMGDNGKGYVLANKEEFIYASEKIDAINDAAIPDDPEVDALFEASDAKPTAKTSDAAVLLDNGEYFSASNGTVYHVSRNTSTPTYNGVAGNPVDLFSVARKMPSDKSFKPMSAQSHSFEAAYSFIVGTAKSEGAMITGQFTTMPAAEKPAVKPGEAVTPTLDKKEEKSDNVVENNNGFDERRLASVKDTIKSFSKFKKPVNVIDSSPEAIAAYEREMKAELDKLGANIVFNPSLMGAALKLGIAHAQNGVNNFAEWSAKMISSVGEKIRPYLPSTWQMINTFPEGETYNPDLVGALFEYAGIKSQTGVNGYDALRKSISEDFGAEFEPYAKMVYAGITSWKEAAASDSDTRQDKVPSVDKRANEAVSQGDRNGDRGAKGGQADSVLGTKQAENVSGTRENDGEETGLRSPEQSGRRGGEVPEIGDVLHGREDTGESGVVTAVPGGRDTETTGSGREKQPAGKSGADAGKLGNNAKEPSVEASPDVKEKTRPNYHIDNPEQLIGGTPKVRFARNKAAIEAFLSISLENKIPTKEELDAMASYIGWGSFGQELFQGTWERPMPKAGWEKEDTWLREHLGKEEWESAQRSIINAHYTDPITVKTMWDMVQKMGFRGGRVLEPSMGVGNFFGMMPLSLMEKSQLTGIELDKLTGGMAKILYPDANIQIKGYQESKTADNFYDLVIGNFPFSSTSPADRRYLRLSPTLHDFFFLKALDQVRPGGLVVAITSAGTMDKAGRSVRIELARKAELIASFRMPSGAFEQYAGTSVVTDIVVLKKRAEDIVDLAGERWIETTDINVPHGSIRVNQYYADNPSNVLGQLDYGRGTTSPRPGMIVNRPDNLKSMLEKVPDKLIEGTYIPNLVRKNITYVSNNTNDRQGSVIVDQKGDLMVVQGDVLAKADDVKKYSVKDAKTTSDRENQIKSLVAIRKAYAETLDAERSNAENTEELRKSLREQYQSFVKSYGTISDSFGIKYLKRIDDPFYPLLKALERDGKPASIFERRTVRAIVDMKNPTIEDAFVLSRNKDINVSIAEIANMAHVSEEDAAAKLIESGAMFRTPAGNYEVSDQYLSGNVRLKLQQAQDAVDSGDESMQHNVDELKKAIPETVPYYKIEARLGAPWVGIDNYVSYVGDLLGVKSTKGIEIGNTGGSYKVHFSDRELNKRTEATTLYGVTYESPTGVKTYQFDKLLTHAFNNTAVTLRYKDEDGVPHVLEDASAQANEKIGQIRERFTQWLWQDSDRKIVMEKNYNDFMNSIADAHFDGSFLQFPGMALQRGSSQFSLRKHQENAIWRGLVNRKGIYGHEVGTGKTFTMVGLAVESRRFGLARKPLLFAHNANSDDVARDANVMYPGASVLYIESLTKDKIKTEMNRIATEDWDLIVVPHSLISRFTLKEETLMAIAADEIAQLEDAALAAAQDDNVNLTLEMMDNPDTVKKLRSHTAKELVTQRNDIIENIRKQAIESSKEDAIPFEDLGVDMILVDEAHMFKKPPLATRMKMKGLAKSTSDRSLSLYFLTSYVKQLNNGSGVHVFTGTPITNSLVEIYNMMRYVMDSEMKKIGVADWDSWFASFADSDTDVELTPTGDYEPVTRLAQFVNTAELRQMAGQFMDIVFADDMPEFQPRKTESGKIMSDEMTDAEKKELTEGRSEEPIGRPYKRIVNSFSDMTPPQRIILDILRERARKFKAASPRERMKLMKSGDPSSPVIVETDSSNAGVDARLFDLGAKDHSASKVNRCIGNVLNIYNEHPLTTQVIFMERGFSDYKKKTHRDGFGNKTKEKIPTLNLAKEIVEKLTREGIPREQIAIVSGSTSKEKRTEIADAMNKSQIRVVIGSTETLGVGVNMQENLRAMHHMDAPWMPGDLEQRNGRGHRQGNKWNTVLEYRYLTNKLDGRRWQVLAIKSRFIKAFLTADKTVRIIEGDAVDLSDSDDISATMAEATGDPRRMQANKLKNDVKKLERRERNYLFGIKDAKEKIQKLQRDNVALEKLIGKDKTGGAQSDLEHTEAHKDDDFSITIGKTVYTEKEAATESIQIEAKKIMIDRNISGGDRRFFGEFKGFKLFFVKSHYDTVAPSVVLERAGSYDAKASVGSIEYAVRAIKDVIIKSKKLMAENKESIIKLEAMTNEPFYQQETLDKKRKLLADLEDDLLAHPNPLPAWLIDTAPVGTEIYVDKKPHVVDGHRDVDGDYFVIADGKPYHIHEVKDENGIPLYGEQSPAAQQNTTSKLSEGDYEAGEKPYISDSDYTKDGSVYYYSGIDPLQLIPGLRKYSDMTAKEAFNDLVAIGRKVFEETTHGGKWMARMKELLGDLWGKAKSVMGKVWNEVKRVAKDNRGAIRLGGREIEAKRVYVPPGADQTLAKTLEDYGWKKRVAADGTTVLKKPEPQEKDIPDSFVPPIPGMDREVAFEFEQSRSKPELPTGEAIKEKLKAALAYAKRKYVTLPRTEQFAPLEFALTQLEHKKGVATDKAVRIIEDITKTLQDPRDYQIFSHKVVFDDIAADLKANENYEMPFGLTKENFQANYDAVNAAVTPNVQAAIDARKEAWGEFKKEYIKNMKAIDFDVEKRLTKGDTYFHHIVLDYAELKRRMDPVLGSKLRTPSYRGFLKNREGSTKNILTDYLEPEMEVMGQMMYDVEIAKTIALVQKKYDIQHDLKRIATLTNEQNAISSLIEELGDEEGEKAWRSLSKKQAMAITRLGEMAFNDELPNNGKWDDILDALVEMHNEKGQQDPDDEAPVRPQMELSKDRFFGYLNYLMHTDDAAAKMTAGLMFKGISEKAKAIKAQLGKEHVTWRDLIPEGYEAWQPREGNLFFSGYTIPEHIAQALADKAVQEIGVPADKVRRVLLQGGKRREMVVPVEVASTLEDISPAKHLHGTIVSGMRWLLGKWKQAVLTMPTRFMTYNFNNLTGDVDAAIAGQGHKFLRKTGTAMKEAYGVFYKGKEMSQDMRDWFERGGFETLLQTQEAGKISHLSLFDRFMEKQGGMHQIKHFPQKVWNSYWRAARKATDFRESILRYAKYLDYLEQMQQNNGTPNEFGASDPKQVMALDDIKDRAFKLSNELLGAYDSISAMGQDIRATWIPFWSWKEVNLRRYAQLVQNATIDNQSAAAVGAAIGGLALRKAPFAMIKLGKFAIKVAFLTALLQGYNWWVWPEEERDLGENEQQKMHIILGRDADGKVRYVKASGAFADILGWVNLDTPYALYDSWLSGRKSIKDIGLDMAKSPVNIVASSITPYLKAAYELTSGKSIYPDVFRQRPIRDKGLYLASSIALGEEYRAVFGLPHRPYDASHMLLVRKSDPLQAAYYSFMGTKQKFMESKGKGQGFFDSSKADALRNYKESLRYQDEQSAVKYLELYKQAGGTREGLERSLESMNPTAGLTVAEKKEFLASLGPEQRRKMDMAQQYFDMVIARSGGALSVTKKGVVDVKVKGTDLPTEKKPKKQKFF